MNNREMAKDYLRMALADATAAMSSNDPYSICFHCQQEVEKYFKAFLAFHGRQVPKSHDLGTLLEECIAVDSSLASLGESIAVFEPYAVKIRYQASKEIAERDCPMVWGTSIAITSMLRERLCSDLLDEVNQER